MSTDNFSDNQTLNFFLNKKWVGFGVGNGWTVVRSGLNGL